MLISSRSNEFPLEEYNNVGTCSSTPGILWLLMIYQLLGESVCHESRVCESRGMVHTYLGFNKTCRIIDYSCGH